jgi:hypothetical protein
MLHFIARIRGARTFGDVPGSVHERPQQGGNQPEGIRLLSRRWIPSVKPRRVAARHSTPGPPL